MAQISIIKKSELEGAMRLDAEYYQPKYLGIVRALQALGAVPLSNVAKPVKRRFTPTDNPFNYIEIAEVDIGSGATNAVEIAGMEAPSRAQWIVREGDVIVSAVRPARNAVALIGSSEDDFVCSSGFIVLRPFKTSAEFLFAYLKTSIVASLLDRKTTATMYPAVSWDDVLSLPVVLPDSETQRFVSDKVKKSRQKLKDSDSLYIKAEQLLLDEIGFKDLDLSHQLYYTVPFKKTKEANRLDAEYFQPAYDEVIKRIVGYSNGYSPLLGCVESVKADFDSAKYPDKSFLYVELADIDASIGVIHSASEIKGEDAPSRARRILRKDDVIVSSVEGSLEKVALADEESEGSLASTGFFQFRARTIYPEVLFILSKSIVLQAQLKKECAGTILTAVPNESLKRILVPLLPPETQEKIASLVQQSHEARRKAKELLEEAKRKVEDLVEERGIKGIGLLKNNYREGGSWTTSSGEFAKG